MPSIRPDNLFELAFQHFVIADSSAKAHKIMAEKGMNVRINFIKIENPEISSRIYKTY